MTGFQHQISIVLQVKNLEQVKQQLKSILPREAPENMKQFGNETQKTNDKLGKTKQKAGDAAAGIKKFTGTIFSSLAVIGLFNRGVSTLLNITDQFGQLERAGSSFERVIGDSAGRLDVLREATRGTVNNLLLLKTATRAVTEGLQRNQLKSTFEAATVASRRLGLQTEQTIQTITKAITRHDESALSTLGIILKNNKEYRVMMNQIAGLKGPAKEVVAIQMRHQFVLSQLNRLYGRTTDLQADSLEKLEKFRTSWDNLRMNLGRVAALALDPIIGILTKINNGLSKILEWSAQSRAISTGIKLVGTALASLAAFATFRAVSTLAKIASGFLSIGSAAGKTKGLIGSVLGILTRNPKSALLIFLFKLTGGLELIAKVANTAMAALSVFFDVLDYDRGTGIAKVLKSDMDALGRFGGPVVKLARMFTVLQDAAINAVTAIGNHIKKEFPWMTKMFTVLPMLFDIAKQGAPNTGTPLTRQSQDLVSSQQIESRIGTNFLPLLVDNMKNSFQTLIDTAPWNRNTITPEPSQVPLGNDQLSTMETDNQEVKLLKKISDNTGGTLETQVRREQKEEQSKLFRGQ